MPVENVLDDREAETRATALAAALDVDTIEPFGEPRDRLARNTLALILDRNKDLAAFAPAPFDAAECDPHGALFASVFDRVVDEVLEHLRQLIAIANGE